MEGIGEDFIPPIADLSRVKKAYRISDRESLETARELLRAEGILAGSSSGTLLAAALRYCREQDQPRRVCTLVCDSGNKYLSKMFDDLWMVDQGLSRRPRVGDLTDLVTRRFADRAVVTVGPGDTLHVALKRHHQTLRAEKRFPCGICVKVCPEGADREAYGSFGPYHALAERYLPRGAGSVFTFGVKGGYAAGVKVVEAVELWSHLANVGDSRSLILHPASTTHRQLTEEQASAAGAGPGVVRLSVGLETADDLIRDLDQALRRAAG